MDNLEKFIQDNRVDFDSETPNTNIWAGIEDELDDEINRFVRTNRASFDTEIPNLKVWAAIDKQINKTVEKPVELVVEKRFGFKQWALRIAAAIALLIVGAGGGFYLKTKQELKEMAQTVDKIAPDFREAEQFYSRKVQNQLVKLASFQSKTDPSVLADLQQIDEVQKELKQELDEAPNATREEIVKRMIDNYKIKLGILERVMQHLDENPINNPVKKESQQHEKI
jgi:ribosomal protein S25